MKPNPTCLSHGPLPDRLASSSPIRRFVLTLGACAAALFVGPARSAAADFFVVQANGAGGAYTTVNAAITAAIGSAGGAVGDTIEIRSNTAGQTQVFTQGINLSSVNISSTNTADWLTIRVRAGDRARFRTTGTLLTATGTSRGWKLEGNSLGYDSLQFGDRADYDHVNHRTCYPHDSTATIASTCSNYIIRRAQFTGARDFSAINFDGTDYELDTVAAFDHGTNHYNTGATDWGDLVRVKGLRVKMTNLLGIHGGHQNWTFFCRSSVLRNSDFSGYWGDISPSPGARATSFLQTQGGSPYGPMLMEGVIVRDSADSADEPNQAGMKTEGNRVIIRDSFFWDIDSHLWHMNFTNATASNTSYFSGFALYHNTSYISKGTWWNNVYAFSGQGNAQFENNLIANNLFQQVSDNDKDAGTAQILRYNTSGIGLNGHPNGFHATVIKGNAIGGPSPLKRIHLTSPSENVAFAIDAPPAGYTANVSQNVLTAVTFANVGSPRSRTKAGFAVTNWGTGASAGDAPPLTTIATSSSSNTITVVNARPFYDGWGIRGEVGDYLYIGSTASAAESAGPVQISSISSNTITLTGSRAVTSGQGVWFGGNAANGAAAIRKNRGVFTPSAPPTAPSSLTATAVSSSQINLSWTDNASNETGFEINRATNSTFTAGLTTHTVGTNTVSFNSTGLSASTTYYYRVRAVNSGGNSSYSNTANATTQSGGGGGGTNLLANPGFETTTSWTNYPTSSSTQDGTNAYAGTYRLKITGSVYPEVYQQVAVTPGAVYEASVWNTNWSSGGTARGQMRLNWYQSGTPIGTAITITSTAESPWMQLQSGSITAPAGATHLRLTLKRSASVAGNYYFDEASIVQISGDPSLTTWLEFDESSGTNAADSSGNGNTGTLINGPTWIAGQLNGGVNLDGTNDHVSLPSGQANFSNGMTVAVWAYPEAAASSARFFDFGNGASADNIVLSRAGTTTTLRFKVYIGSTMGANVDATGALTLNTWQHLAVTIDSSGNVKLYKNGAQAGSGTTSVPANVTRSSNYIGRSNWTTDSYFDGRLDDFRVYNRVLSASEIAALP